MYSDLVASVTFINDPNTLLQVQAMTATVYEQIKSNVPNMDWLFLYTPQPKIIQTYSKARGGNVLGLADLDHDQISKSRIRTTCSRKI